MNENGSHLAISQLQPMRTSRTKVWIGFYKSLDEVTRAKLTRGQRGNRRDVSELVDRLLIRVCWLKF